MLIQHFFTPKIAHSSYLLAGSRSCAVVDPQRDVEIYLDAARARSLQPVQRRQPARPGAPRRVAHAGAARACAVRCADNAAGRRRGGRAFLRRFCRDARSGRVEPRFERQLPIFAGWVLPTEQDLLLVADNEADVKQATVWARRVGLNRIAGYLKGGMSAWVTTGHPTNAVSLLSGKEARARIAGDPGGSHTLTAGLIVVDVRAPGEFAAGHIEGALNIPAPDLRTRYIELDRAKPTLLICSSGNRSSLAASILKQRGFVEVYNIAGGTAGYDAAG